jgi:hypothetical protein
MFLLLNLARGKATPNVIGLKKPYIGSSFITQGRSRKFTPTHIPLGCLPTNRLNPTRGYIKNASLILIIAKHFPAHLWG